MSPIIWMLACFGFTFIVVYGNIFKQVRSAIQNHSEFFGELINCPLCFGFWVGLLGFFLMGSPTGSIIFDMCLSSIGSWIGTLILFPLQGLFENYLQSKKDPTPCKTCGEKQ